MHMDKDVRRLLTAVRQPYQIIKKKDHYFLHVPGHAPVVISGNGKSHSRSVFYTIHTLKRIIAEQRGE